ncbi:hypothetical protein KP509_10G013300 [Ceratopteris richardii]|uniref:Uncharacterized protein n=1 Tax=Ceratopteris richardii TaxID=49495 RepID=A0A8T2TZA2_CERRI|nr:hypothetical protein KP509_10G013300 [Ceratopteris richardii]
MARFTVTASSFRFLLHRQLSSSAYKKFSLAKLQRHQVSSRDVVCPYERVPESVEEPVVFQLSAEMQLDTVSATYINACASGTTDGKESCRVWWGPDVATGTWTPSIGAEKTKNTISSPSSVLHGNPHNTDQAFWYREDLHL